MKYIWGWVVFRLLREYAEQVWGFCKNYWWVILILLVLMVIGWIVEWKEKKQKRVINKKLV